MLFTPNDRWRVGYHIQTPRYRVYGRGRYQVTSASYDSTSTPPFSQAQVIDDNIEVRLEAPLDMTLGASYLVTPAFRAALDVSFALDTDYPYLPKYDVRIKTRAVPRFNAGVDWAVTDKSSVKAGARYDLDADRNPSGDLYGFSAGFETTFERIRSSFGGFILLTRGGSRMSTTVGGLLVSTSFQL